jgi:pantetheine-phosphate adenylyltransferase
MAYAFKHAILGGTFDHFHLGHENFLTAAFAQSRQITIGIVKETSVAKHLSDQVESYATRLSSLTTYLITHNLMPRTSIIPLSDIYGTSLTDKSIEAIFVTQTTKPNAELINVKRQELGLTLLDIITVPFSLSDDGEIISSSRIRAGLIDREGPSYLKQFMRKSTYRLPSNLRSSLEIPLGIVVKDLQNLPQVIPPLATIISVGDIVSMDLSKAGYIPKASIIDYHTRRKEIDINLIKQYFPIAHHHINNDPATINTQIAPTLLKSLSTTNSDKCTQVIVINGEEDLLVIPAVLLSPLGSYVIYGQYRLGMIIAQVTEELKSYVKHLLAQFS